MPVGSHGLGVFCLLQLRSTTMATRSARPPAPQGVPPPASAYSSPQIGPLPLITAEIQQAGCEAVARSFRMPFTASEQVPAPPRSAQPRGSKAPPGSSGREALCRALCGNSPAFQAFPFTPGEIKPFVHFARLLSAIPPRPHRHPPAGSSHPPTGSPAQRGTVPGPSDTGICFQPPARDGARSRGWAGCFQPGFTTGSHTESLSLLTHHNST